MSKSSRRIQRYCKITAFTTAVITMLLIIVIIMLSIAFTPDFREIIDAKAIKYKLDNRLLYAVILAESNYEVNAKSNKGAVGLMQLMPSTAEWLTDGQYTEADLYKPDINIELGARLLSMYYSKYSDFNAVLCAYNAGEGNLAKWLRDEVDIAKPPFKETADYIKRVKFYYRLYSVFNEKQSM